MNPISRREFLQAGGAVGLTLGLGLDRPELVPEIVKAARPRRPGPQRLTILHTADMHAQLDPHDEFFWENERAVFKKRGGFACLRT